MPLITLEEFKALKGIAETSKDIQISAMIPVVEGYIKGYCNDDFLADDGSEAWPAGLKLVAADMIEFHMTTSPGITSQSLEGNSVSYATDYPETILKQLRRHRKVGFV